MTRGTTQGRSLRDLVVDQVGIEAVEVLCDTLLGYDIEGTGDGESLALTT